MYVEARDQALAACGMIPPCEPAALPVDDKLLKPEASLGAFIENEHSDRKPVLLEIIDNQAFVYRAPRGSPFWHWSPEEKLAPSGWRYSQKIPHYGGIFCLKRRLHRLKPD